MKVLGLLAMAAAAAALPVLDNVMADGARKMPLFSHFGDNKKVTTKATGNDKATGTGNFLHGLTELNGLTIPKRDAAPVLPELTVGVQGGEVVKREAKNLPLNLGSNGVDGNQVVKSLPLNTLTGILKRWIGMEDGEGEAHVIEKRAGKKMGKGRKLRKGKGKGKGMRKGMRKAGPPTGGGGPLGQLDNMKDDGANTGGVGVLGMPLPIGEKKE